MTQWGATLVIKLIVVVVAHVGRVHRWHMSESLDAAALAWLASHDNAHVGPLRVGCRDGSLVVGRLLPVKVSDA